MHQLPCFDFQEVATAGDWQWFASGASQRVNRGWLNWSRCFGSEETLGPIIIRLKAALFFCGGGAGTQRQLRFDFDFLNRNKIPVAMGVKATTDSSYPFLKNLLMSFRFVPPRIYLLMIF